MKVRRYHAPTMRQALEQVRAEQGPDVIILSNRKLEDGVELITALESEELELDAVSLAPEAVKKSSRGAGGNSAPEAITRARPDALADAGSEKRGQRRPEPPAQAAAPALWTDEGLVGRMQEEMKNLRSLVERQAAGFAWKEYRSEHPLKANLVRDLGNLGVHPRMARDVVGAIDEGLDYAVAWRQALARLARCIRITESDLLEEGGVIAMVGPAGAGKTSVIAKAAAQFAVRHRAEDVAVIAADTVRVGAWQQLRVLGRALSINVYPVRDAAECAERVLQLAGRKLVLIDTAGLAPDAPGQEDFRTMLTDPALGIRRYLVSPANIDYRSLQRLAGEFAVLEPEAWVMTRVDESAQIGTALSVFYSQRLPLAAVSAGQRIPDDLERAVPHRLVARAVRMAGGVADDDATDVEQFAWAAEQAFA